MALSDLQVYSEYAYSTFTEVLQQQIELFNAATDGALLLSGGDNQGDYSQTAFFAKIAGGAVRRRNAYGAGTVNEKTLMQREDVSVKIAAGTPPIRIDPGQFNWIKANPEVAGAVLGQQIAVDSLADMLNVGLGAVHAALSGEVGNVLDISAAAEVADQKINWVALNKAQALFGDASSRIGVWVMHSAPMHGLFGANLQNANNLFNYGSVNVIRDPFGKLLVMTDASQLVGANSVYSVLGLTPGAVILEQNGDFDANEETKNGGENIIRTYQAEWSYNASIKGFAWDKTTGGKSPNDAALNSSANWDKIMTDKKDLAGVLLKGKVAA